MLSTKILLLLAIGRSLAVVPAISCKKGYYQMCCIANYDLQIPTTACVPLSSMPPDSSGQPYCGDLVGIDTVPSYFENCCNINSLFSQTCATINGVQSCGTSKPNIKCTEGGIN